jgi:hypothetical protein
MAASLREKASNGMATEVVDPTLEAELSHQRIDPEEPRAAVLPALEIALRSGAVDMVSTRYAVRGWIEL